MIALHRSGAPARRWRIDWRVLAAQLSGVLLIAAFPPLDWGWLAWVAIVPLLWSLAEATPRQAAGRGYLAGVTFMLGVGAFTSSFGGSVLWMKLLPWFLFTAIEGLFYVPIALLIAAILRRGRPWQILIGVPAVWVLGEAARGWGPLGFPFGTLAYALHNNGSAIQCASLGGCYLVSGLAALMSVALYLMTRGPRERRWGAAGVALIAVTLALGYKSVVDSGADGSGQTLRVEIAQGASNAAWGTEEGDQASKLLCANTLYAASRHRARPDLAVWSESATGYLLSDPIEVDALPAFMKKLGIPLLTGTAGVAPSGATTNLAVLLRPDGSVAGTYQKRRLVPFGEWVPLRHVLPFLNEFGVVDRDEIPGKTWNVLSYGPMRLGVPICFESAAPEISREFVRNGANLLCIITNDAWFGRTGMAEQHAAAAQLRAVETRRWVVRCGHTGISGFITPSGAWTRWLPLDDARAAVGHVELQTGSTFYVKYGDWFLIVCGVAAILSLFRLAPPLPTTD